MTRLDVTARAQAQRMIDTYGKAITFTRIARGSYDPNTSTVTPAQTTQSVKAYLSSPSKQQLEKGVLATSMVALARRQGAHHRRSRRGRPLHRRRQGLHGGLARQALVGRAGGHVDHGTEEVSHGRNLRE
jgi:hypothetical protein